MNISIFGLGYVGCVSVACLSKMGHNIIGVDIDAHKIDLINSGKPTIIEKDIDLLIKEQYELDKISATDDSIEAVLNTDLTFIAVGTPSNSNGQLNLDSIYRVAENIGIALKEKESFHIIAIRSTILPGTCKNIEHIIEVNSHKKRDKDFSVLVNPEFLREGSAVEDYYNPPLTLIGANSEEACNRLAILYENIPAKIIIEQREIVEIMKLVNNTFHALKVSFANEIGNICSGLGIDSQKVMDIFCKDTQLNISPYYFKPGFAYGGSCLPKDLKALQLLAHDNYIEAPLINSVDKTNQLQIKRCVEKIEKFGNRKLGFLGLSFKAGTDDLRNSPIVELVETLLGKGYEILIYDNNVNLSRLHGANKSFIDEHIPHLSKYLVDNITDIINYAELIVIGNKDKIYLKFIIDLKDQTILDLVALDSILLNKKNYFHIN